MTRKKQANRDISAYSAAPGVSEARESIREKRREHAEERAREKAEQQAQQTTPEQRFDAFMHDDDPEVEVDRRNEQERRKRMHTFLGTEYAKLSAYVILTFVVIYALKKIGDHLPTILLTTGKWAGYISALLKPLMLGFAFAYLLYPLMKWFMRMLAKIPRYKKSPGRARPAAVACTMVLTIGLVILILSIAISAVTRQLRMVSLDDLTGFVNGLATSIQDIYVQLEARLQEANISSDELSSAVNYLSDLFQNFTSSLGSSLTNSLSNLTSMFTNLLFAIIFAIYFLLDAEGLQAYWDRVLHSLTSKQIYRGVHLLLEDADTVFSGYIRGQIIDAVIMFGMVSVALTVLGIPFSIIVGILTGLGNLIPYVGPFIAYASTIILCLLSGEWKKMIISIIVLFIIQTIDGNVINPKLLSNNIHVHPMLVIVALIFGGAVGGIVGMLVAVPVAALIKIWFDRAILMLDAKKKEKYADIT